MDKPKRVTPFSKGGSHYKPPSGIPAKGAGWGGAKSGSDTWTKYRFSDAQPDPAHKQAGKMEAKAYREKLRAKLDRAAEAYDVAFDSGIPHLVLAAAKQIEDRVFGQAKQVVETQDDTRTEAELIADVQRKRREAGFE